MHVDHAVQAARLGLLAKVPGAHGAHVRSLLAVATAVVYEPAAHGWLTDAQATPPSKAENEAPTSHGAHWRSAMTEPALDIPEPAGHVAHALQDI